MKTMQILRRGLAGWTALLLGLWGAAQDAGPAGHPPSVELTVGTEGPYVAPETLLLVAHVDDADGWVRQVVFRANDEVLAEVNGDSRSMGPLPPFRFVWRGVLAGKYVLTAEARDNDGLSAVSASVEIEVAQSPHAFIFIRRPEPEARFAEPARIEIGAVAVDPKADIRRVVFFANNERIGVSEFLSLMPVVPGRPIPHGLVWEEVPAGEYVLTARAEDAAGNPVDSNRVPIVVELGPALTEVTVRAVRAEALEGAEGEDGRLVFRVVRSGPVEEPLTVYYRLRGSATPGEDYKAPGDEIEIPAGREAAELVIPILADNLSEGPETVVVELLVPPCPEIFPPPPGCYVTGVPSEAEGVIVDREPPPAGLVLVPAGSEWAWWNRAEPPAGDWLHPTPDDPEWPVGPAQLGYGDGDEATVTREGPPPHPLTAYFRKWFVAPADLAPRALQVRLVRDDGAAVYLNGVELLRDNLPDGELTFETPASHGAGENENAWHTFVVPAEALREGDNLLAVEVHQHSRFSSDLSFDLELTALTGEPPAKPVVSLVAVVPETAEPSPETRVIPGRFRISRTGPVDRPLGVVCRFAGSAEPERDYRLDPPPGPLSIFTIPAGQESLDIYVGAVDDRLVEGDESVVAELDRLPLGAPEPFPGNPYQIDPDHARAVVVIHDNDQPSAAELVIHHPPEGAVLPFGEVIPVHVTAIDPKGYIARVEVYADGDLVGVSQIEFVRAPDPGTPIEHTVEWKGAAPGEHTLVARAVNSAGQPVESEPVHVLVEGPTRQVILAVEAPNPDTAEPGPLVDPAPAAFVIRRVAGPLDVAVRIFFKLDGSARNGVDYREIPRELELPAGREALEVPLVALADDEPEEPETVIFRLLPPICPMIYPPPPWCYLVGEPAEARIVIHDTPPANRPPRVGILHPRDGAVVMVGDTVEIVAGAEDPDGEVTRVALLLDGRELAASEGPRVRAEWTPEAVGEHVLGAVATDDAGATGEARPVRVLVREAEEFSFVRRELPPGYLPGQQLRVRLLARPPGHGLAWAVEDQPPAGWEVSDVTDGGRYDPATGRVKFGPFFGHGPRTLAYVVRAPADATGPQEFTGEASVNGQSYPVSGDRVIEPGDTRHPADQRPPERALTMEEVTAYATAWKTGQEWPAGPNPIPLSYVTRAGYLWKHGEAYAYDPAAGPPPLCWVPASEEPAGGVGLAGTTDGWIRPMRALPSRCRPGAAFTASVTVQPPPGTSAWAAEEIVPPGWKVMAVGGDGQYDPASRRIRWGVFFDDQPRELSYTAAAPGKVASVGRFHGTVSFDGLVEPIQGSDEAVATDESTGVKFSHVERDHDGRVRLRVRGAPGQVVVLEVSNDLRNWAELGPVGLIDGELEVEDLPEGAAGPRFYRARPVGP